MKHKGNTRIELANIPEKHLPVFTAMVGRRIPDEATAVVFMKNGAVRFIYPQVSLREKLLSKVVSGTQSKTIESNYRWQHRKVNSKGAAITKAGNVRKPRKQV